MANRSSGTSIQLFPKEIVEFSAETFLNKVSVKSQIIYTAILCLVVAAIALLPFVHVPISVQSRGTIRSQEANAKMISPVSGQVVELWANENMPVRRGEAIVRIDSPRLSLQNELLVEQLEDHQAEASDLTLLLSLKDDWSGASLGNGAFATSMYESEYFRERRALAELQERARFVQERHAARKQLFTKDFISRAEFLQIDHELKAATSKLALYTEDKRSQWEAALRRNKQKINEINNSLREIESEKTRLIVTAPESGVIQQIENLKVGSYVTPGQALAVVSPSDRLIAEIYVSTRDIGLIDAHTPASLQIDAFNHLEWGRVAASIMDISKDVYSVEGVPMFRILCQLDRNSLTLSNGAVGRLKKGMTVTARFEVAQRSLFQLLRDSLDDWFTPYAAKATELQPESAS